MTQKTLKKKKEKRNYIPGLAQLSFEISEDWNEEEALKLWKNEENIQRSLPMNTINYDNCISGMQNMPRESIDLIIADPPFGIDFSGKGSQYNRKSELIVDGYVEIEDSYEKFSEKWIQQLERIMKSTSSAYIVSGWTNLNAILNAIKKTNLILINHIIWKYQFGVFTKRKFVSSHYHILFLVKDEKNYYFNKYEYYPEDVWTIPRKYHPGQIKNGTKLPEELVCKCINFSSKPGDLIFDPFMGNGTTAICAKGLFRHYFGFEMNPKLQELHSKNIDAISLGEFYRPLKEFLPSKEDLLEKYPHLHKYLD